MALFLAGFAFLLFPVLRPWFDESTEAGAIAAFGAAAWITSHLLGALGFILVPLGLLAINRLLARRSAGRPLDAAVVLTWLGAGLLLPYYGAETFALNAIATSARAGADLDVLALSDAVRNGAAALTTFGLGLLAVAVGAIAAAIAISRSGVLPRYAGVLMAVGLALYLPQFFGPPWLRIAHGALLAVGLFILAGALWGAARDRRPAA